MFAGATHAGIEEVAHRLVVIETLDGQLGAGAAARGLHLDFRQAEPALDDVARQMDVLDAGVRQRDLAPEQDSPAHRDAFRVDFVTQRVVSEIQHEHEDREAGSGPERREQVVLEQIGMGMQLRGQLLQRSRQRGSSLLDNGIHRFVSP